jgi:hypothetical protein
MPFNEPFMKRLLLLIVVAAFFSGSCKRAIEKKKEDMIMAAITDGVWMVEQYFEGASNISSVFHNYDFRFYNNGSVTGTNGADSSSGTWSGDASNYSISSQFPTAGDPIKKLNGVWKIKDSYWDYVKAEMTTSNGINILHLKKK